MGENKTKTVGLGGRVPETEGVRRASVVSGAARPSPVAARADPEVAEKAKRRRFTAEYKLQILEEAERRQESGEIGALLRREGLYTSNLSAWREQRRAGALHGLGPRKRGRKRHRDPQARRINDLEHENVRLREELRKAQIIVDVQKKVARLLGNPIPDEDEAS